MKIDRHMIAGTALGLLMATAQGAAAAPSSGETQPAVQRPAEAPIVLAQADIEVLKEKLKDPGLTDEQRKEIQQQIDAMQGGAAPAEQAKPAEQAPAEAQKPAEEAKPAEQAPAEPQKPAEQAAPAEEQKPAEAAKPAEQKPAEAEQPKPAEQAAPAEQQKPAEEAKPAETAPAEQKPAEAEQPKPAEQAAPAEQQKPAEEAKPAETAPAEQKPAEAEQPKKPAEQAAPAEGQKPAEQPAQGEQAPARQTGQQQPVDGGEVLPENAAPVLDSQKEAAQPAGDAAPRQQGQGAPVQDAAKAAETAAPAGPPPATDADAQKQAEPVKVESLTATEGKPVEAAKIQERMQAREGADVVRTIGDRVVIQFNNQTIVESNDRPRLTHGARDVRYEDLPGGWTREVISREGGVKVITIRDRYGDIIRRSRVTPDGREYVLVYASDRDRGRDRGDQWRDPGRDLPPLRLTIPVNQYILDAGRVEDPDRYYQFLEEPPVEPVRRLYSLDEVKYSARVRDTMRRIDLDVINFEFGSASIGETEVQKLQSVADAISRIIEKNPAETFLIEGHTDAVGSDQSNLVLSDKRAESVAAALTSVFDIPPENLVTQGYGERYLKVATQDPSRDNRRVAIRRITPLVAPVASAN